MNFCKNLSLSLLIICTIAFSGFAQSSEYLVRADNLHSKSIHVEATFTLQDDVIYMSPYGPAPERWDDYIQNVRITDYAGESIRVSKQENEWIVDAEVGQTIHLSYDVSVTHDDIDWPGGIDGVAFVNDNGYFLTGRSLFLLNGQHQDELKVTFRVPDGWNVSTPWEGSENNSFMASDQEALMESLIMIGSHSKEELSKDGLTIRFVLSGDRIVAQSEQFRAIARETMNYYIDMMGGSPTPGGKESAGIMVTINEASQVDGEVIGGHISILMDPESPPQQRMVGWLMFAHEFFHLWNGKTLQVAGTREDWFKEGITNYYTLKALYQIGFINEQALAGVFNGLFYQRYRNDPGLGELSMRDAAEGFSKDNHWGLIYGGGLFAGIALDVMMREKTQNDISLDDLMRALYVEYSGTSDTYTTEEILSTINGLSGVDATEFFDTHITGKVPIPIERYLQKAGFEVQTEDGQLLMSAKPEMDDPERQIHEGFLGKI